MRVDPQINRYKSRKDYIQQKKIGKQSLASVTDSKVDNAGSEATNPKKGDAAKLKDKTDISQAAKSKASSPTDTASSASSAASSVSSGSSKIASALKNIPIPRPSLNGSDEAKDSKDTKKVIDGVKGKALPQVINGPGIFFITDMSLNPFHSEEGGLTKMAENIPTAKTFSWGDRDEIVDQVKKHNSAQPILLIGHGMGGDTAVEVANELNNIEHGFRQVNLLVTLDSIGMNNDIIPQNVAQNLNIISDGDMLFNDGPNIARKTERTEIINELRSEDHNDLDDSSDVQFQIFDKINLVLGEAVSQRNVEKNRIKQLFREHGIQGVHR